MEKIIETKLGKLDASAFPIVIWTTNDMAEVKLEDIKPSMDQTIELIEQTEGDFVMITDATRVKWMGSQIRAEFGKSATRFEKKFVPRYKRHFVVVPNVTVKFMLKGINLVLRPTVKQTLFTSYDKALKAAEDAISLQIAAV